jgi:predicted TIM-barrel fold metal-dependent hydrolase
VPILPPTMARIDAHSHLTPTAYRVALENRGLGGRRVPVWSADLTYEYMARWSIDAAVVSVSTPGVWFGDQGLANELARICNEETAGLVRSDPTRFAGLAVLPLPDVEAALAELAHALDVLGLDGVGLLSNVDGTYPGDPAFGEVLAELDRRGAYAFLHPTSPPTPSPMPAIPDWVQEYPFETTRALVSLIYEGALERFPRIRWQIAHLGGAATFLAHRIEELGRRDRGRAEPAPAGGSAYLARLHYDTGLANNAVALAAVRELAGTRRIVFGTDWPYAVMPDRGDDPAPGLDAAFDPAERSAVEAAHLRELVPRLFEA